MDETAEVRWVPLDDTLSNDREGRHLGAITIIGVQHVLLRRAAAGVPSAAKSRTAGTSARGRRMRTRSRT